VVVCSVALDVVDDARRKPELDRVAFTQPVLDDLELHDQLK